MTSADRDGSGVPVQRRGPRLDPRVWAGVERLLDDYAEVRPGDHAVVLYTSDAWECAAWVSAGLGLRGVPVARVWMAPLEDDGFPERLAAALPPPGALAGRLVVVALERDTLSHAQALAAALDAYPPGRRRVIRTINAGPELFARGLSPTPGELSARNAAVLARLARARDLRITTAGGTDLSVALDPRYAWISNRGMAPPGGVVVLPAGEVATFPASIRGRFVADFAVNVNLFTELDCRLADHPVAIDVEGGRGLGFRCADPGMTRFLGDCFARENAWNVGELGFGTHPGIGEALPMNSHLNERRAGLHLGFGQHNQPLERVPYRCAVHVDLIARGARIFVDGDPDPLDLEDLAPAAAAAHPGGLRGEDVFSPVRAEVEGDGCCAPPAAASGEAPCPRS